MRINGSFFAELNILRKERSVTHYEYNNILVRTHISNEKGCCTFDYTQTAIRKTHSQFTRTVCKYTKKGQLSGKKHLFRRINEQKMLAAMRQKKFKIIDWRNYYDNKTIGTRRNT